MKNRILLSTLPFEHVSSVLPPMGLLYIAAALEKKGFEVRILEANLHKMSIEKMVEEAESFNPSIIGFSVSTAQLGIAKKAALAIKEKLPKALVIFGGAHASVMPEECLNNGADIVVMGEGEITFLEIAQKFDGKINSLKKIEGIAFKEKGRMKRNPARALIQDLDSLPFPARHLVPVEKYFTMGVTKTPFATILTSRGCPGKCIYCNKSIFTAIFRARSSENIVKEIQELKEKYNIKEFDILDDTFSLDLKRAERICDLLIEKGLNNISWRCSNGLRVDKVSESLLKKMRKAGCHQIAFGVESGNDEVLKKIGKEITKEQVRQAFKLAKKARLETVGFFMIGLPFDTKETMQQTIDFAIELDPDYAQFTITTPLPGTRINSWVRENTCFEGYSSFENFNFFSNDAYFETENFTKEDVSFYYKKAYKSFYYRPRYFLKSLMRLRNWQEIKAKITGLKTLLGLTGK